MGGAKYKERNERQQQLSVVKNLRRLVVSEAWEERKEAQEDRLYERAFADAPSGGDLVMNSCSVVALGWCVLASGPRGLGLLGVHRHRKRSLADGTTG